MTLPEQLTGPQQLRFLIDAVCAVATDRQALAIARWCTMNTRGRAATNLEHYLSGKGGTRMFDLQAILREDCGVNEYVTAEIRRALATGRESGEVFISQQTYRDQDWRYALGGMVVTWRLTGPASWAKGKPATISLAFKNKYCWHPSEPRVTQALHVAAERLKVQGARDFWMEGRATLTTN